MRAAGERSETQALPGDCESLGEYCACMTKWRQFEFDGFDVILLGVRGTRCAC